MILAQELVEIELVKITVGQLGFKEREILNEDGKFGVTVTNLFDRASSRGLCPCPAEVGLQLLPQYEEQEEGESLHVAMAPLVHSNGTPAAFVVCNKHNKRWVQAFSLTHISSEDMAWVFTRK